MWYNVAYITYKMNKISKYKITMQSSWVWPGIYVYVVYIFMKIGILKHWNIFASTFMKIYIFETFPLYGGWSMLLGESKPKYVGSLNNIILYDVLSFPLHFSPTYPGKPYFLQPMKCLKAECIYIYIYMDVTITHLDPGVMPWVIWLFQYIMGLLTSALVGYILVVKHLSNLFVFFPDYCYPLRCFSDWVAIRPTY